MKSLELRRIVSYVAASAFAVLGVLALASPARAALDISVSGLGSVASTLTAASLSPTTISAASPLLVTGVPGNGVNIDALSSTYQFSSSGDSLISTTNAEISNTTGSNFTFTLTVTGTFNSTGITSAPAGIVDFTYGSTSNKFKPISIGSSVTTYGTFNPVQGFGTYQTPNQLITGIGANNFTITLNGTSNTYTLTQVATVLVTPGASFKFDLSSTLSPNPSGIPVITPEPASMAIWGIGALGMMFAGYRRRKLSV